MTKLTQQYLQSLFNYKDGELYWKIRLANRIKIDDKAGTLINNGYYMIRINGKQYLNHRLIFLYFNGYLPEFIDHIDGNKENNHIENLRKITLSQNGMNQKSTKHSSSKYKGVSWAKRYQKWQAQIYINNKQKYLGRFNSEIEAAKVYNESAIQYFGKYAKLNEEI